jgi:aryl-alcohol dehydrogenase-like predicted oxidoreductase
VMVESVQFGASGLRVSEMALGTMMFGSQADFSVSKSIADYALSRGVYFWDTADMYGNGASEEICGRLLTGRRERVVLATKVYAAMSELPNQRGLSAKHIMKACDDSLKRLRTDYIDIYYLHLPDRNVPLEETLRAMEDLCRSGRVRYVACSNFRAWEVMELLICAERNNWQPITGIQPLYNIVNRDIEVELLPMASKLGLGVTTYSPLARGVLTGKYSDGKVPEQSRLSRKDKRFIQAEWRPESVQIADALRSTAERFGCTLGQLATAWAMRNSYVHSVIIGPKTLEQAKESIDSAMIKLDQETEQVIDSLVPPGCHSGYRFFDDNYSPVLGRKC